MKKPRLCRLSVPSMLAVLALSTALAATEESAATRFLETIDVRLVNLEVFVEDKRGHPISGLDARDFELVEDGKQMKISHFRAVPTSEGTPAATAAPGGDRSGPEERYVLILVDNYAFRAGERRYVLSDLEELLETEALAGSRLAVAAYEGYPRVLQSFTTDREAVERAVTSLSKLSSLGIARQKTRDAYLTSTLETLASTLDLLRSSAFSTEDVSRRLRTISREVDLYAQSLRADTRSTFQSLSHVVNALAALPGRKAVVLISEGRPMRPGDEFHRAIDQAFGRGSDPDSGAPLLGDASLDRRTATFDTMADQAARGRPIGTDQQDDLRPDGLRELAALANASRVSFYTIKPREAGAAAPEYSGRTAEFYTPQIWSARERNYAETLAALAADTGGRSVHGGGIETLVDGIEADFGGYYSLAYSPPDPGDGRFHRIAVRVKRKGARVRTRSGYLDKPVAAYVADRTSAALLLGMDDNPLGVGLEVGEPKEAEGETWAVPIVLSVPLSSITLRLVDEVHRATAQVFVAAMAPDGDAAPVQVLDLRLEIPAAEITGAPDQTYEGRLMLQLRAGKQRLAVGLVDPVAQTASFVSRDLEI